MTKQSTRMLFAGESWSTYAVHTKGANSYTTSAYEEGAKDLLAALASSSFDVTYMRNHEAAEGFPYTADELASRFDVVVLSDIPADSLLLPHAVFIKGEKRPNRLRSLAKFVERGGGLLMVGGYMSFAGFEGRARYASTPLAQALPVVISHHDDRIEESEGVNPEVTNAHPVLAGISGDWPYFLGYNRFEAKPGSQVILSVGEDPFLVVGRHGSGRVAAFASDCSPHWGSPEFTAWPHYSRFWSQLAAWLAGS
jgi:uncharacterized membrane protein